MIALIADLQVKEVCNVIEKQLGMEEGYLLSEPCKVTCLSALKHLDFNQMQD